MNLHIDRTLELIGDESQWDLGILLHSQTLRDLVRPDSRSNQKISRQTRPIGTFGQCDSAQHHFDHL